MKETTTHQDGNRRGRQFLHRFILLQLSVQILLLTAHTTYAFTVTERRLVGRRLKNSPASLTAFSCARGRRRGDRSLSSLSMVLTLLPSQQTQMTRRNMAHPLSVGSDVEDKEMKRKVRRKYKRKRIPETERELKSIRAQMQHEYEKLCRNGKPASLWSFESLFPEPVWDEVMVKRDLYGVRKQDAKTQLKRAKQAARGATTGSVPNLPGKMKSSFYGGSSMMRIWREPRLSSAYLPSEQTGPNGDASRRLTNRPDNIDSNAVVQEIIDRATQNVGGQANVTVRVDRDMTRMVEDKLYGYRRLPTGDFQYDTSLMGDGAVQFRDGVRLGNPLRVNADRLNYFARKEMQHGKIEEAQEMYEKAIEIDPRDGRAYLGLGRCAERRRDFKLAREFLRAGIANSVSVGLDGTTPDRGGNPFLLQALGCLEEKMGDLAQAEALYIAAAKSRPTHAAAWVALARLRTSKLGQSAQAGRVCYQTAERELQQAGLKPSAHVYTAWASLEYNKVGDVRRSRELYKMALDVDPKCSAAYLQLGVMEAACSNWDAAEVCFEKVLKFDQRNSRVLQAYALMETKRPGGSSRKAIGLFERALKANPRDAGVLQPYALYVAKLGDVDAARELLRRGTQVNKRDAPVWQAWGVLEAKLGSPSEARKIFQQGIWACAQLTGGQSGGYHCARLWQAWGVLEAREGDHPAARRCFSRALDADSRNIPAITAWASMEEELGNISDARSIFERALSKFAAGSDEKNSLWRSYELMEQRLGHVTEAQKVYQRAMREALAVVDEDQTNVGGKNEKRDTAAPSGTDIKEVLSKSSDGEVEVVRWNGLGGEAWMNDRAIESKVPGYRLKRKKKYDT